MRATWRSAWACATTRSPIVPMFDAFRASRWRTQFAGLAGGRDRREHPGAHPRHAADGAVKQVRCHRADHRQQERDGDGLLHAVRRHGRRFRGHQGRGQDAGLPAGGVEERAAHAASPTAPAAPSSRSASSRGRPRPNCGPDQKDQDSLPPYEVLDAILVALHGRRPGRSSRSSSAGYAIAADVERVTRLIKINEYKRRQAPVGIRITHRAFGRDWRYPITSKFRA